MRVLILEDDLELRFAFHETLSNDGFDVVSSATAEDACCYLEERCPDVLILDYLLGSRNSLEVAAFAASVSPETKVLFLTGSTRLQLENLKKFNSNTCWILRKPVKLPVLSRALNNALRETKPTDGSERRMGHSGY